MKQSFFVHRRDSLFRQFVFSITSPPEPFQEPLWIDFSDVTGATLSVFGGVWRGPPIRILHVFHRAFRPKSWLLGGCELNSPGEGFGNRVGLDFGGHFSGHFLTPWSVPAELPSNAESSKKLAFLIHSSDLSLRKPKSSCF